MKRDLLQSYTFDALVIHCNIWDLKNVVSVEKESNLLGRNVLKVE